MTNHPHDEDEDDICPICGGHEDACGDSYCNDCCTCGEDGDES